jgi:hypothetical protein
LHHAILLPNTLAYFRRPASFQYRKPTKQTIVEWIMFYILIIRFLARRNYVNELKMKLLSITALFREPKAREDLQLELKMIGCLLVPHHNNHILCKSVGLSVQSANVAWAMTITITMGKNR